MHADPRDADVDALRLPPHSLEAEQHLLGAMLFDPAVVDEVADRVSSEDFFSDAHRRIHAQIAALVLGGQAPDVLTCADALQAAGDLDRCGGLAYLAELRQAVASVRNAKAYADIVRDRAMRRRIAVLAADVAEKAYSPARMNAQALLDELARGAALIADGHAGDEPIALSELAPQVVEDLERREAAQDPPGLSTGIGDLDALIVGLQPGDLVIVAGRPSMGKTALGVQFAIHAAVKLGKPGVVFSLEMKPRQIAERAISHIGHVDSHDMRIGKLGAEGWSNVGKAIGKITAAAPLLIDGSPRLNIEKITARSRRAHRKVGLSIVVIDYLQLIEGLSDDDNRNQELGRITRGLKLLGNELGVPVILLSQLNREVDKRTNKRPMLSDLRDSGAIEADADVVMFVYRDEVYHPDSEAQGQAEIIVGKQRAGSPGTVYATFLGKWSRFADTTWRPASKRDARSSQQVFVEGSDP